MLLNSAECEMIWEFTLHKMEKSSIENFIFRVVLLGSVHESILKHHFLRIFLAYKTSQLICRVNQLTGFYMRGAGVVNMFTECIYNDIP